MDDYEADQLQKVSVMMMQLDDCLNRAAQNLNPDDWDRDQWGYAYIQLAKAKTLLTGVCQKVLSCRGRHQQLHGEVTRMPEG